LGGEKMTDDKFSFTANELLCSLYYLSSVDEANIKTEAEKLTDNIQFFCGFDREVFESYRQSFKTLGRFPEFFYFVSSDPILKSQLNKEAFVEESLPQFKNTFDTYIRESEITYIMSILPTEATFEGKSKLVKRLDLLLQGEMKQDTKSILSARDIDIVEQTTQRREAGTIQLPIARFNEECGSLGPGTTLTILGTPASGKTTLAENIVFLNSVLDNKNTLYLYLEDMPVRYQYNIFSRFSYHIGDKVSSASLKRGISSTDTSAIEKLRDIQNKFWEQAKGEIYYVGMGELANEPNIFAKKMASLIIEKKIDIVVVDYIQKIATFKPSTWHDKMEYQNQMASILSLLALGQFGNPPILNIMLSQLNREGQKKAEKTRGKMSLFDAAEISSLERDSFVMLGIFSDQTMRDAGEVAVQLLKNRDNSAESTPETVFFDPAYCFIGDVSGMDEVISKETLDSLADWDTELGML
jgi:hypothetical protein